MQWYRLQSAFALHLVSGSCSLIQLYVDVFPYFSSRYSLTLSDQARQSVQMCGVFIKLQWSLARSQGILCIPDTVVADLLLVKTVVRIW